MSVEEQKERGVGNERKVFDRVVTHSLRGSLKIQVSSIDFNNQIVTVPC